MGDHGTSAVELPVRVVRPEIGRRRHRPLTAGAGLVLFVCLFLPAVDGCARPIAPVEAPPCWAPYLYGLVFAAAAVARGPQARAVIALALRVLAGCVIAGGAALLAAWPVAGIVELAAGLALAAAIGWTGAPERRIALSAIVLGALATVWFGAWCAAPGALAGVYLSLAGALALLAGGLVWLAEVAIALPARVPRVTVRRH